MGTIFMSTLTTLMEAMNLEVPSEAEGHQGTKVKELAGEDLVGGATPEYDLPQYFNGEWLLGVPIWHPILKDQL